MTTDLTIRAIEPEIIIRPPYPYEGDEVMTNFDHSINEESEARLKTEEASMMYSGRDFCGMVWWDRGVEQFRCLVMVHRADRETVTRPTLGEIMDYVCKHYGSA